MNVPAPANLVRLVFLPTHVRAQVTALDTRTAAAFRAAYVASPEAKRRDAKARLVAQVNAHALAPSLAQVAADHVPAPRLLARELVPCPAPRSALATCQASNAPGGSPVATIARGPNPSP